MSKLKVEFTLFHADWCGHCVAFKPHWDNFIKNNKNTNITTTAYADNDVLNLEDKTIATINGKDIQGYPTLKIKILKNNKTIKEYEYSGERNKEGLDQHVNSILNK
jgi:thiol-disulfide isomerase/thioredoxin